MTPIAAAANARFLCVRARQISLQLVCINKQAHVQDVAAKRRQKR
jgi:hypothetical protein